MQAFQDSGLDIESTGWRNEFVDNLIKNDVQKWATKTVQGFLERLGYLEWPSTKALVHPVHRISTRFTCTRCSKTGPKATRNKSLTFREAAHHLCLVPEQGNKDQWSPKNFAMDVKVCTIRFRCRLADSLNKWKGGHCRYPIRDRHWRGRARENCGRFGGYFTAHNVSILFSSYRDEVRCNGESDDLIQGTPLRFMLCEPHRCNTRIGMTIWSL